MKLKLNMPLGTGSFPIFRSTMSTRLIAKKYIRHPNTKVFIYETDETGENLWAICVEGTDFWLNAFKRFKTAIKYCEKMKLNYYVRRR